MLDIIYDVAKILKLYFLYSIYMSKHYKLNGTGDIFQLNPFSLFLMSLPYLRLQSFIMYVIIIF